MGTNSNLVISAVLLGLIAASSSAYSASFDCARVSTQIEKMICGNQELSDLDSKMEKAYKDVLGISDYRKGLEATSDQKKWIRVIRSSCRDVTCLKSAYLSRIDELNALFTTQKKSSHDIFLKDVIVKTQNETALHLGNPNEKIGSFNSDIAHRQLPGRITQCRTLIDVPVGTAHGNHSFGGLCTYSENGHNSSVMICDDEMVGHFKMEKIDHEISAQKLVDFVVSNCFGG